MDPVSIVVGALTAGALGGAQEVASSSIKDSYERLKSLLRNRLSGRSSAETALTEHEHDPQAWEPALHRELSRADVVADPEIIEQAEALLRVTNAGGSVTGDVYNVDARGSSRQQFGRGNAQYNQAPPADDRPRGRDPRP